jgi:hypothetical protein
MTGTVDMRELAEVFIGGEHWKLKKTSFHHSAS